MLRINFFSFRRNFIAVIATLSSLITIYSFCSDSVPAEVKDNPIFSLMILLFVSIVISLLLSKEREKVKIKINNNTMLNVFVGDLGNYKNVVIPVNDYFDTQVDDFVVSPDSLHGKFIKNEFGGNTELLGQMMDEQLVDIKHKINSTRRIGRKKYYPLGTTIKISYKDRDYYLVVLTQFDSNNKANLNSSSYQIIVASLLDFIATHSQGKRISLPLIGGSARTGLHTLSKQQKLELIILSMMLSDRLSIDEGLDIVISKNDWKRISLNRAKFHMIS